MKIEAKIKPILGNFKRATKGSAGHDLKAVIDGPVYIAPGEVVKIPSGISLSMDNPYMAAIILPRSGTATKRGLVLANTVGLIDSDYQGEIIMAIKNVSSEEQNVQPGERIAQLVFMPILLPEIEEVEEFSNETDRGEGGFGSTGS